MQSSSSYSHSQILPGTTVTDNETGMQATIPFGWNGQKVQNVLILQNPQVQGAIIISHQQLWTKEQIPGQIQNEIQDQGLYLSASTLNCPCQTIVVPIIFLIQTLASLAYFCYM